MVITGIWYALGLAAVGALTGYLTKTSWLGIPFYILAVFCLWFFRDPDRVIAEGAVAVSPADGKVVSITKDLDGRTRLGIFLNVFDVHVNRSPIAGVIRKRSYKAGKFLVASNDLAGTENEQNTFVSLWIAVRTCSSMLGAATLARRSARSLLRFALNSKR